MTPDELAAALRPVRLPEAAGSLASSDLAVAALVGLAAGLAIGLPLAVLARRRRRPASPRAVALAALARAEALAADERPLAVAALLRAHMAAVAGADTLRLEGEAWLAALDRQFGTTVFSDGSGRRLGADLYGPPGPADAGLVDLVRPLIERERG